MQDLIVSCFALACSGLGVLLAWVTRWSKAAFFSLIFALGSLWCHQVLHELISRKEESQSVRQTIPKLGNELKQGFLWSLVHNWLEAVSEQTWPIQFFSAWWWMYPKIYLTLGWKKAGKVMSLAFHRLPHAVSCICRLLGKCFLRGAGLEKTSSFDSTYLHIQMLRVHFLVVLPCKPSNVVKSLYSCYANPALAYCALLQAGDVAGGSAPSWRASPPRLMRGGC